MARYRPGLSSAARAAAGTALIGLALVALPSSLSATQVETARFGVDRWCADSGTVCWDGTETFSGIRFVLELDASFLFQRGANRFEGSGFRLLPKFAVEVNAYKSWAALQLALFGPSTVVLDRKSPARRQLVDTTQAVSVDWGFSAGLSFLNSSLATGWGRLFYDRRDFRTEACTPRQRQLIVEAESAVAETESRIGKEAVDLQQLERLEDARDEARDTCHTNLRDSFVFFSFQPVSALRSSLKEAEEQDEGGGEGN